MTSTPATASFDLGNVSTVHRNLSVDELIEHAIRRGEGQLAANGALVAKTGKYTGRTPKDKYVVRDEHTEGKVWWENNQAMTSSAFEHLLAKAEDHVAEKELYVIDTLGGASPDHRIRARFIVEK